MDLKYILEIESTTLHTIPAEFPLFHTFAVGGAGVQQPTTLPLPLETLPHLLQPLDFLLLLLQAQPSLLMLHLQLLPPLGHLPHVLEHRAWVTARAPPHHFCRRPKMREPQTPCVPDTLC